MKQTQLTPEQMMTGMQFAMILLAIVSMWVVNDARNRGKDGWTAFWWGLGTLMALIVALPLWLIVRPQQRKDAANSNIASNDDFTRAPLPEAIETPSSTRSKICDHCGKFYLGKHDKCPHCQAPLSTN